MGTRFRKAASRDYNSLLALFEQGDLLHRESLPDMFVKPEGRPREKDYFEDLLKQPDVGFFIAEDKDQIIGFVHAVVRDSPPLAIFVQRRFAVVESVVVRLGYQGKGIGRQLMEVVHKWALDKGAGTIELNVYEFNEDAMSFYKRLGYDSLSRRMRKAL